MNNNVLECFVGNRSLLLIKNSLANYQVVLLKLIVELSALDCMGDDEDYGYDDIDNDAKCNK